MQSAAAMPEGLVLPGGLVLDEGHLLKDAELRPLTGREEEWLAASPAPPSAIATTRLLSSCLVRLGDAKPSKQLVRRLLVGDRDYLILQVRRATFGDEFHGVLACPACGGKMDVSFDTRDVPVTFRPQTVTNHSIQLDSAGRAERTVRFRLPCGADQEAVLGYDTSEAAELLLDRCVLDSGGVPLSLDEREAIANAMDGLAPQIDLELDLTCPECEKQFSAPFDTTAFFFSEMKINGRQLLHEIHSLAFYYHWSEAEIVRLPRDRRRAYLGLLSDALHQE